MRQSKRILWYTLGIATIFLLVIAAASFIRPEKFEVAWKFYFVSSILLMLTYLYFIISENASNKVYVILLFAMFGCFFAPIYWFIFSKEKRIFAQNSSRESGFKL